MIDGVRLGKAKRLKFKHNDLEDLKSKVASAIGDVFVGVESVYSMDGDMAPLKALVELSQELNFQLIVDEAHATGVFGPEGKGLSVLAQIEDRLFARIVTFGKAMGGHGAAVIGSEKLRSYLINYARSFIYSTALPLHSLVAIKVAHEWQARLEEVRTELHNRITYFRNAIQKAGRGQWLDSTSSIQSLIVPGNEVVMEVSMALRSEGINVLPVRSPTVPEGKERLRICLHAFNTEAEIDLLFNQLKVVI